MNRTSRILAAAGVVLLIAGCGDGTTAPVGAPPASDPPETTGAPETTVPPGTTDAPSTTVAPDDSPGGFGPPVPADGEFDLTYTQALAGTAALDDRGCWWLDGEWDRGLLLAPPGTELGDAGDALVGTDGTVVADGDRLDVDGVVMYGADELPGGADGRWGNYLAFCEPGRPVVVAKSFTVPVDTDLDAAAAELADDGARLFDTDHGCGYGFASGSADERWALHLYSNISDPIDAGTVTLPDDRFEATILVGRNLFANHCDDVFEWFEPTPTVAATWPIVAGSFTYPGSDGTGNCDQGAITTTLDGAVVDVDGTPVELGPITIENRSFGCFAG